MESKKIRKETTRTLSIRLPKEVYKDFIDKCNNINIDKDKAIKMLIGVASGKCGFHTLRAFSPLIPMVCRLFRYSKVYIVL